MPTHSIADINKHHTIKLRLTLYLPAASRGANKVKEDTVICHEITRVHPAVVTCRWVRWGTSSSVTVNGKIVEMVLCAYIL